MKLAAACAAALLLLSPVSVHAQGCSQCRETVGQAPPRTQTAYRRGIAVLGLAATGLFATTLLVGRRFKPSERPDRN